MLPRDTGPYGLTTGSQPHEQATWLLLVLLALLVLVPEHLQAKDAL
jgi:hypothetical protein